MQREKSEEDYVKDKYGNLMHPNEQTHICMQWLLYLAYTFFNVAT